MGLRQQLSHVNRHHLVCTPVDVGEWNACGDNEHRHRVSSPSQPTHRLQGPTERSSVDYFLLTGDSSGTCSRSQTGLCVIREHRFRVDAAGKGVAELILPRLVSRACNVLFSAWYCLGWACATVIFLETRIVSSHRSRSCSLSGLGVQAVSLATGGRS